MSLYLGGNKIAGHGGINVVSCTIEQYEAIAEAGSLNPHTLYVTEDGTDQRGKALYDAISVAFMRDYKTYDLSVGDLSAGVTRLSAIQQKSQLDGSDTVVVTGADGVAYSVPVTAIMNIPVQG